MPQLRDHACECDRRSCRERVYLTVPDYRDAATRGRVVVIEHAAGDQIERHRTYAIVTQDRAPVRSRAARTQAEREPQTVSLAEHGGSYRRVGSVSTTRSSRSATKTLIPGGTRV